MVIRPLRLLLALLPLVLSVGCTSGHSVRLEVSNLNTMFTYSSDLPFSEYIKKSRGMVKGVRLKLQHPVQGDIIAANTPFELLPDPKKFPKTSKGRYAKGILLIHGLSDSPYHLKAIGEHLRNRGFLVRAILLPGHGTVPGDLIDVKYEEWIKATEYGVRSTRPLVDKLYVAGFSAGGTLGVHYALTHDDIEGLLLFSPALAIKSRLAWLSVPLRYVKTWLTVEDDLDFAKYESFAVNGAAQIYTLTKELDRMLGNKGEQLTIPVFIALSLEDFTIDSTYTLNFFDNQVSNPQSRLLVFASDTHTALVNKPRYVVVDSTFVDPDGRVVLDFAHTSITIPPGDPHYGANGDYRNCLHYGHDSKQRQACLNDDANLLGERTAINLRKGIVQRLTFNPRYDLMINLMDDFLFRSP